MGLIQKWNAGRMNVSILWNLVLRSSERASGRDIRLNSRHKIIAFYLLVRCSDELHCIVL